MSCGHEYRLVHWEQAGGGNVPSTAVPAGWDQADTVYVGRVFHEGEVIPGKILPSHGVCYISQGGAEHGIGDYEVLCNPHNCQLEWVGSAGGNIPSGALQGGVSEQGEPLYVGRVHHEGSLTIGKIHPSHGCCYIPYGGSEHSYPDYEVLVCKCLQL